MRKTARLLGGVDSLKPGIRRGKRLHHHHHGGDVRCVVLWLCVTVKLPTVIKLLPSCWEVECMDVRDNHMWCLLCVRVAADMVDIRHDVWVTYLVNQEIDRLSSRVYPP